MYFDEEKNEESQLQKFPLRLSSRWIGDVKHKIGNLRS